MSYPSVITREFYDKQLNNSLGPIYKKHGLNHQD